MEEPLRALYHEGAPKISRVHLGVHLGVHKGPGVIILKCFGQHGHIGSNQMNQNVEPKTFSLKEKLRYLA